MNTSQSDCCVQLNAVYLFVSIVSRVILQLQHDVINGVVRQPDGGRVGLQPRLQAKVFSAMAQDCTDILDGED